MILIKVLLIGGSESFFVRALIDKLLKEKFSLYHIPGKKNIRSSGVNKKIVTYNIDIDDEHVPFVVRSVMPDTVIYLGAFDDSHIWKDYHRCSAKYMCELTNVLVAAADLNIKQFVYLSTINVYGFDNDGILDEETPVAPSNVKSIVVAQGERLCKDFCDSGKIQTFSLRFGNVYGDSHFQDINNDYIMKKCMDAITNGKITVNNQVFPVIAVSDAAIAVWKAIYLEAPSGIYNVCDSETISDAEISDIILTEYSDLDIAVEGDERFKQQNFNINGEKFKNAYSFYQMTKYKEGIVTIAKFVRNNQAVLSKQKPEKENIEFLKKDIWFYTKFIFRKAIPFLETFLVFAVFALFAVICAGNDNLKSIDALLLFVIIIAITFGKKQALVAVLLSTVFFGYNQFIQGQSVVEFMTSYSTIVRVMFLYITGMIVGHTRDRLNQKILDYEERIEYVEDEYKKLDEINDVTISVKKELEERLLSYSDSLAKNYSILEKMDSLVPSKIYIRVIDVICNILKTRNVCVYVRNRDTKRYDLDVWSTVDSIRTAATIDLSEFEVLNESFDKDEVYVNKQLDKDLPVMASAIKVDDGIEAVIMVWDIEFESLLMYHINLFITLSKLVHKTLEKALYYRNSLQKQFRMLYSDYHMNRGFFFYSKREFMEAVNIAKEGKGLYSIPYSVLSINLENITLYEALDGLQSVLTGSYCMYRSAVTLEVLLNNSDGNEVSTALRNTINEYNSESGNRQFVAADINAGKR